MSENMMTEFKMGEIIPSPTTKYVVEKCLDRGTNGLVIRCSNGSTSERVALKISLSISSAQREEAILQTMKQLHSHHFNIVRLKESFSYKKHHCLVFENLDMNLRKFMSMSPDEHLELKQIRPILQQLATTLEFLQNSGIVHAALKPDNVMMVDHVGEPMKIKVIDFGSACKNSEKQIGCVVQSLCYRSPEILQKAPFSGAVDVWSLGCIAAELFIGQVLFPSLDEDDLMNDILMTGKPVFWLKHWVETRFLAEPRVWGEDSMIEATDMELFVDLLKAMLKINPLERITPSQILQHPFITMSHLAGPVTKTYYVKSCSKLMESCMDHSSDDGGSRDQKIQRTYPNKDSSSSRAGMRHVKIANVRSERQAALEKQKDLRVPVRAKKSDAASQTTRVHSSQKRKMEIEGTCPGKRRRKKTEGQH